MPRQGLSDDVYKDVIKLLYNRSMVDELDIYASIQDLLDAVFFHAVDATNRRHPARPETAGQYVYSPALADYLLLAFDVIKSLEVFLQGACYIFVKAPKSPKTNHIQSVAEQITSTKDLIGLVDPPTLPKIVCRLP